MLENSVYSGFNNLRCVSYVVDSCASLVCSRLDKYSDPSGDCTPPRWTCSRKLYTTTPTAVMIQYDVQPHGATFTDKRPDLQNILRFIVILS